MDVTVNMTAVLNYTGLSAAPLSVIYPHRCGPTVACDRHICSGMLTGLRCLGPCSGSVCTVIDATEQMNYNALKLC